ncbi:hypothetical protein C8Q72DRAFT_792329 [Fomitopsis betulina]|nr:hypothetical protein C8Q72DRAFT_792329 [Fomitopsis betulina]
MSSLERQPSGCMSYCFSSGYVCVVSVFFGKGVRGEILVVPVETLFAFTQLRSTMPGAPSGFDFMGTLLCLALLTFSSIFMSAVSSSAIRKRTRRGGCSGIR